MENKIKNYGVLYGERSTDYRAGATISALPFIEVRPDGDWESVLPSDEKQYNDNGDSMSCVTFAELSGIETQMNDFLYTGKMSDELIQWSIDGGLSDKENLNHQIYNDNKYNYNFYE